MDIVTGFRGENHITSNDDQGRNQGIFGTDAYVLSVGSKFSASMVSANGLQIADGEGVIQGVHFRTVPTDSDIVTIENGQQGLRRIDLVCVRYEKNTETNIESVSWYVHQGEAVSSNPAVPSYTQGNILAGDTIAEMPMYQVALNGITVSGVTAVFKTLSNIATMGDAINSLNTDLALKSELFTAADYPTLAATAYVRKFGKIAILYIQAVNNIPINESIRLFTLPKGFLSIQNIQSMWSFPINREGTGAVRIEIEQNGNVNIYKYSEYNSPVINMRATIPYFVN